MTKKNTDKPNKYKLGIVGPGASHQTSTGACIAHSALQDFLANPAESGLDGIVLQNRGNAEAIKEHLDAMIIERKIKIDPNKFIVVAGYKQLTKTDLLVVCADAGTDYVNRFIAGVPPSAEDSFDVNNKIILGGTERRRQPGRRMEDVEFKGLAREIAESNFNGSIGVVTNPSDYMAHLLQATLYNLLINKDPDRAVRFIENTWGFTPEKQRKRKIIAKYLSDNNMPVSELSILAQVVGPHDDRAFMLPVFSQTRVEGFDAKKLEECLDLLFLGRHTLKEQLRDYARAMMVKAGNTSTEVGLYIQDPIKMMVGQNVSANISRAFKLSDEKNMEMLLGDFRAMNKEERTKAVAKFTAQDGLNSDVAEYVDQHAKNIINFEKFLEKDPGAFLSLPYERVNGILRVQEGFRLNQSRFDEPIQFLAAYMKSGGFGTKYIKPFSIGQKPEIEKSEWDMYQKMVGLRFIVKDRVGYGGQGTVLHVADRYGDDKDGDGKEFALKIYSEPAKIELSKDMERFYRQVRIQTHLNHPNIIKCYGLATGLKEHPGLLLEFISHPKHPGVKDLDELYIKSRDYVGFDKISEIFTAIGGALQEIHSHRTPKNKAWYVHRDVKPKNFLLAFENGKDVVKLGDFGAAAIVPELTITNQHTMMMGTLSYLSPEGVAKDGKIPYKQITPAMDTYSAGVSLYELATGWKPERDDNGNFEGVQIETTDGKKKIEYRTMVSRTGNPKFRYFDDLVKRCLDPEWEAGKTNRPLDGEEFLNEVIIASNYDVVNAYESAIETAVANVENDFAVTAENLETVNKAQAEVHKTLSEDLGDKFETHLGKLLAVNSELTLGEWDSADRRNIFAKIDTKYAGLVTSCYSHIEEFAKSAKASGNSSPETAAKVKRYKAILKVLPTR